MCYSESPGGTILAGLFGDPQAGDILPLKTRLFQCNICLHPVETQLDFNTLFRPATLSIFTCTTRPIRVQILDDSSAITTLSCLKYST